MKTFMRAPILAIALFGAMISTPQPAWADATPECNNGAPAGSTECGANSTAAAANSTAIGASSNAGSPGGLGISTAVGANSNAEGIGAVAVGAFSRAGDVSVAAGFQSIATGGGVAIGWGSEANGFVVSFGNGRGGAGGAPATRQLVNVSVGVQANDAVNVGQMDAANALQDTSISAVEAVNTAQDTRMTTIEALNLTQNSRLAALEFGSTGLGGRVGALEAGVTQLHIDLRTYNRQATGGIAAALALGGATIVPDSKLSVSFNLSTYRGQQGFSGSVIGRVSDKVYISGGIAGSTVKKSTGGRVGITFGM